jgi:hypothetical protein
MMTRHVDKDCLTCLGTGEAFLDEKMIDGEWWAHFEKCHCVSYFYDEESVKELIRRALARSSSRLSPGT